MANKNFVVKNGLEVNTNLVFADSLTDRVGIATTSPRYTLHVVGGIGATSAVVSGIASLNNISINGYVNVGGTTGSSGQVLVSTGNSVSWKSISKSSTTFIADPGQDTFIFEYELGTVEIYINGVRLTSNEFTATDGSTIVLNDACFGGETVEIVVSQSIVLVNPGVSTGGGESYWVSTNAGIHTLSNVGIGTTNPTSKLTIGGTVSATAFVGDGSGLTNLPSGGGGSSQWITNSAGIHTLSNVGIGTTNPQTKLQINGVLGFGTFTGSYGTRTNIRIGDNTTGASITDGYDNIFMGIDAGNSTTTGNFNNFIARAAGQFNTTGNGNNFFGFGGGYSNTTGNYNSFFGDSAGYYNTTGNNNTFFGTGAGIYNSTGNFNTLFGTYTGLSTSSSNRVIIGSGYEWSPTGLFDSPNTTKDYQLAIGIRTDSNPSNYWIVGDENFNVGIGTTIPTAKLHVGGDAKISDIRISGTEIIGNGTYSILGDLKLIPNDTLIGTGQYVKLRPTTNLDQTHIHIEAGNVNNADLYLGDDDRFVKIDHTGPVVIGVPASATTSNWTAPSDGGPTTYIMIDTDVYPWAQYLTLGDTVTLPDTTVVNIINNYLSGNTVGVYLDSDISYLTDDILVFGYTPRTEWKFNPDSSAVFPGNLGIGTTNPQTKLQINGVLGFGTFTGSYGTRTNIRIGDNTTGASITDGYDNIFMGIGAGNSTTTGRYNNFFGFSAGRYNTTGSGNNFLGLEAGLYNSIGLYNNFIGDNSGYYNTTGCYNNFFGESAGNSNISGSYNNFFGNNAGYANTTGNYNNFFGNNAGYDNTTGSYNNFFGTYAGYFNVTGSYNNFFGTYAGKYNTVGNHNIFLGAYTGISTSASHKVVLGSGHNNFYTFDSPNIDKNYQLAIGIRTDANPSNYWIVGDENFNVGIGTTNPTTKLEIAGNLYFTDANVKIGDSTTGSSLQPSSIPITTYFAWTGGTTLVGEANASYNLTGINGNKNATNIDFFVQRDGSGAILSVGNLNFEPTISFNEEFFIDGSLIGGTSGVDDIVVYVYLFYSEGTGNVLVGRGVGRNTTTGRNNIFLGDFSGAKTTTGKHNNFLGSAAGHENINGENNNFLGEYAGYYNTSGSNNNLLGLLAGYHNTTGNYNNFFGLSSGEYNTTGSYNNYFGVSAGRFNTTGSHNNFFGNNAGWANTTGNYNNFFGESAGNSNISGSYNNFFGRYSGYFNATGSYNSFFGTYAGKYNTVGNHNIFLGAYTGISTSASHNVVLGTGYNYNYAFDSPDTNKDYQLAIGIRTDANPSNYWITGNEQFNLSIGGASLTFDTQANEDRIYIGRGSGTGYFADQNEIAPQYGRIVIGAQSGIGTTTLNSISGYGNIIIGNYSGLNIARGGLGDNGSENIFLGSYSADLSALISGDWNTCVGNYAGRSFTNGRSNSLFGRGVGRDITTGSYNSFFGTYSGSRVTIGGYNSFFGYLSGWETTTGQNNNFFGSEAGRLNKTGNSNTFVGYRAGYGNTSGSYNTFLGFNSGISTSASYKVIIGSGTNNRFDSPNTTKDYQLAIGIRTDSNPSNYWIVGDENFNVGIGTTRPTTNLDVGGTTRIRGFIESQEEISNNSNILSLNGANGTVFTHTTTSQIGIVSFSGISTARAGTQTFSVIVTQGSTPVNITPTTGIGTQLATIVTEDGVGYSTHIKVGSGTTLTLTNSVEAIDLLTFIVSYDGNTSVANTSFRVIAFSATDFRGVI